MSYHSHAVLTDSKFALDMGALEIPVYIGPKPEKGPAIWVKAANVVPVTTPVKRRLLEVLMVNDYDHQAFLSVLRDVPEAVWQDIALVDIDSAIRDGVVACTGLSTPTPGQCNAVRTLILPITHERSVSVALVAKFANYLKALDDWAHTYDYSSAPKSIEFRIAVSALGSQLNEVDVQTSTHLLWRFYDTSESSGARTFGLAMATWTPDPNHSYVFDATVHRPTVGQRAVVVVKSDLHMVRLVHRLWPEHMQELEADLAYQFGLLTFVDARYVRVETRLCNS